MSAIDYTFVVDLARPYKANTLMVMQHDANSRVVHFLLMNDGKRYDMTGVSGVILTAVTPSEATIVSDLEIVQDEDENNTNEVIYTIPSDITMTPGRTTMVITLYADNLQLSSFEFYVNTRNELYNVGAYDDTDDMTGFRDLLTRALSAVSRIETMTIAGELPNPYPLRLILDDDEVYTYNGAETVEVEFDGILSRIAALEESFPAGCNLIYNAAVAAGVTPTDRSPQALAAAYAVFRQGNATKAQVMSGKTFTSSAGVNVAGTMATLTSSNFSGSHSSTTAGATSNYTVKSTSAGYVPNNTTVNTAAAGTSPTIATTSATGTQVINVKPGIYNKISVNQTNAYNQGKADALISDVDAHKIKVECSCDGWTSITGADCVRPSCSLKVTLPDGTSGSRSIQESVYTSGTASKTITNDTVNSWLTINSMTAYDTYRGNSRMEATFTVTYKGTPSKVYCELRANNVHQSGPADWYSDATSTRYILVKGTTGYQKMSVSSSTLQMM